MSRQPADTARRVYDRFFGPHEVPRELRSVFRSLGPGTVAVDCGANVGRVTALLAARGAEVYAFEPNPRAFDELARRFDSNPRVHCLAKAVAATDGRARLYLHVDTADDELTWSTASSLFAAKPNVDPSTFVDVETVDLGAFLDGLGRVVHLLKLDVEGAEIEVLEQLVATGALASVEHVLVELHDRKIPGLECRGAELRRQLAAPDYRHVHLDWI